MRRLIRQDGRPQAVARRGFDALSSTGETPVTTAHDLSTPGSSPNAGTEPAEVVPAADRGRFWPLAKIAVFDIAGPLVAYSLLRSAGLSTVSALVLSGLYRPRPGHFQGDALCRRRSSHRLEHRLRPASKAHRRGPRRRGPSPRRGPATQPPLADSGL